MEDLSQRAAQLIAEQTRDWDPDRKAAAALYMAAQHTRARIRDKYSHPAELAQSIDPEYNITPAIELISRSLERAIRQPRRHLLVSMPPREGKSLLCAVWGPLRALQINPNALVVVATYASSLAETHSIKARKMIREHGTGALDSLTGMPVADKLGLALRGDRRAVKAWEIAGADGGYVAVGLHGGLTGRGADLLLVDDPFKDSEEADSEAQREKVWAWWQSVAQTRLSNDASVVIIHTRWHPKDLIGRIKDEEAELPPGLRTWRYINIPALSEVGVPDTLGRSVPGVAMTSATGKSASWFEEKRRAVGERVWNALYQGMPAPLEGGLFKRDWFGKHRLAEVPPNPVVTVVAIDPAETGKRDEAGIIGGSVYADGTRVLVEDWSGKYTSDEWGRKGVLLALEMGASEVAVECYTAGVTYLRVVKLAYDAIRSERLLDPSLPVLPLRPPFRVTQWRGKGDAVVRSAALRQAVEVGRTRVVGARLSVFESQAVGWLMGQHQPDRVAAGVIADDRLAKLFGAKPVIASPLSTAGRAPSSNVTWLSRKLG